MRWDEETEVLIIGFGGAGAVAAVTAHDSGSRVLVVEKMERGGGNTNISLGGFLSLKDLDSGLRYLESLCWSGCPDCGTGDPPHLRRGVPAKHGVV